MIYLDNAATTNKKPNSVYKAVEKAVKNLSANAGRGTYDLSLRAAERIYETREELASFLNFSFPERIVFTMNATYALNLAIKGIISEKCHVLISDVEHNSVIRPIYKLIDELGINVSCFNSSAEYLDAEIESNIRPDTKAIVSTLASNVTGKEIPLEILSAVAKRNNLKLIVDASQYIGHKKIDLTKTPCTALCAPAHKALFGIMGLGFAVFSNAVDVATVIEGGSGAMSKNYYMPLALPERLEAGTLPGPAIVALCEGIKYIKRVGLKVIENKSRELTELCSNSILSVPGTIVYAKNLGIVTFNMKNFKSELLCERLNDFGICVRGGFHCAPSAHNKLGTDESGAVRVSMSHFSSKEDVYSLYRALKKIEKNNRVLL